jgi:hypothetical protein
MIDTPSEYHTAPSGSEVLYQENDIIWPSVLHTGLPPRTSTDDSWNPLEHRVPTFNPAYTAFAPESPPESIINEKPELSKDTKPKQAIRKKPQLKKSVAKRAKTKGISWQHTVVMNGGLQRVPDLDATAEEPDQNQKTFGVRKGALDPGTKEKARRIRQLKACWACWVLKVPVSSRRIYLLLS